MHHYGLTVFAAPPGKLLPKKFWLLKGPSGIGGAPLGPQIKIQNIDLQALSAFVYLRNGLMVFTGAVGFTS